MSSWIRTTQTLYTAAAGQAVLANVGTGHTLLRCHWGIDMFYRLVSSQDPGTVFQATMAAGIYVTTTNNPDLFTPLTNPGDADSPMRRWLYWRVYIPKPLPHGAGGRESLWAWGNTPSPETIDTKAMALANGQPISLYIAWEWGGFVDPTWQPSLTYFASVLVS